MGIDKDLLKRFAEVFRGRTDAWGSVRGLCVHQAVTLENYRKHLEGKVSLGIYPLGTDGLIYWSAIDVDKPDYTMAKRVQEAYRKCGYPAYIERSKSMHYHVWAFYTGVPANRARAIAKQVLADCGLPVSTEIFPKQHTIRPDGFGNYINLPYFGKGTSGRVFLDDDGAAVGLKDFLPKITFIAQLPEVAEPVRLRPEREQKQQQRGDYDGPVPACIKTALLTSTEPGQRHATGIRIAGFYRNMKGFDRGDVLEVLFEWNKHNNPPLSVDLLEDCVDRLDGYAWGCRGLKELESFAQGCNGSACNFYQYELEVPEEPAKLQPDPGHELELCRAVASDGLFKDYLDYACAMTDAPRIFHLVSAMAIVAASLGNRVHCRGYGGKWIFPNLWFCLVAGSGFYRKSTAMGIAKELLSHAVPGLALSEDASREQWQDELAERSDRILYSDEFAALLQSWENKYMMGTKAFFTSLYDLSHYVRSTRGNKDPVEIDNPAITILAGSTKDWLLESVKPSDFRSGFLARMLFMAGSVKEPRIEGEPVKDVGQFDDLVDRLKGLARLHGEMRFTEVRKEYDRWLAGFEDTYHDNMPAEVSGLISRAGATVLKLAMIFHVASAPYVARPENPLFRVSPESLQKAIRFVTWVIERQLWLIKEEFALTPFDQQRHRVIELLKAHKQQTMTHGELLRATRWSSKDFIAVVENLVETGDIVVYATEKTGPGRPTKLYALAHNFGRNGQGE